ncbi:MAG: hypothetical protein CME70_02415 [Halobacteriovorax sp.]|nr:hypothetical protein [Halobacteriovorax sp.]
MNILNLILFSFFVSLIPASAFAYIDPGTGGIIVQVILGGIGGLILFFKLYWKKVKSFFSKEEKPEESKAVQEDEQKKSA